MPQESKATIDHMLTHIAVARDEDIKEMWYDWFCKETSLVAKGRKLLGKLRMITPSARFDAATTYAIFKNNCPGQGSLYDDFRICDLETSVVVFCVVPSCGHDATRGEAAVWGKKADGEFGQLVSGTWADVKAFFKMTEAEWAAHEAAMPKSPFQLGVEVVVHGDYVRYGELPKKQVVTGVNADDGRFKVGDNDYRWFKKDGTFTQRHHRRDRSYRAELWSAYEAGQKAADDCKARQVTTEKMRRDVENAMWRIKQDGSVESLEKWTALVAFINVLTPAPAPVKKEAA